MSILNYKGYQGRFEYDPAADIFHGDVLHISDVVTFQGRSIDELKKALAERALNAEMDHHLAGDGGADRRDDRPLDPHHGNRPADFAAHDARGHRQFALALVPDHRALRAAGRRGGQRRGTRRKLQFRSSARSSHNIYTHPYAYCSKTITFA